MFDGRGCNFTAAHNTFKNDLSQLCVGTDFPKTVTYPTRGALCATLTAKAVLMHQMKVFADIAQDLAPDRKMSDICCKDVVLAVETFNNGETLDSKHFVGLVNAAGRCGRLGAYTDFVKLAVSGGESPEPPFAGTVLYHSREQHVEPRGRPPPVLAQSNFGPIASWTDDDFTAAILKSTCAEHDYVEYVVIHQLWSWSRTVSRCSGYVGAHLHIELCAEVSQRPPQGQCQLRRYTWRRG